MKVVEALFKRGGSSSRDVARERLRFILINDRASIPPHVLTLLKDELIQVFSRHLEIDEAEISISLSKGKGGDRLVADVPFVGVRR